MHNIILRNSRLDEAQGRIEQRTEPRRYRRGERVVEILTPRFAKSASGTAGLAGWQAGAA